MFTWVCRGEKIISNYTMRITISINFISMLQIKLLDIAVDLKMVPIVLVVFYVFKDFI